MKIRFRYPKIAGEGVSGPVTVRKDHLEKIRSDYKSKKSEAQILDSNVMILTPEAKKQIDEAIEFDKKNRKKYPLFGNNQRIIAPNESKIIEVEPGTMLVDLRVVCKPRHTGTVYIQKNGRWKTRPMSAAMLRKMKKDGLVKL